MMFAPITTPGSAPACNQHDEFSEQVWKQSTAGVKQQAAKW